MEKEQLTAHIGSRLREIRKHQGLSLEEAAKATGISKPMLGQIERGESNPTVGTLWKIANGLHVPFTSFIETPRPSAKKVMADDLEVLEGDHGGFLVKPIFSKDQYTPFEAFYVDITPWKAYYSKAHPDGVEEYLFLQEGTLEVRIGGDCFTLHKGDALRFEADKDHVYENIGSNTARFTMIIYYRR
ncbi:transcriptional regulator, XRE family with cupin sensor [Alteribacillus persepolensis]|uniref:Transcriptional regulator, XRE family with cupin sensor n=1 Tax=Alteribacillus persepolensis TaxID=568899 RepID=A0A1G8H3T3_9BACI|nr:XRE family transcriptional regulator [Alteribacillus persepolensis]SDI01288.1 transcriptional regulator, XRE family with cupin sensor [Alteribacillus persepolensis]